jgi:hypothetical protein
VQKLSLVAGELRRRGAWHEAAAEDEPGVITGAAHLMLPRFARVSRLEVEVVGLVRPDLLAMIP